jgi:sugar lactone lactonase YvrE
MQPAARKIAIILGLAVALSTMAAQTVIRLWSTSKSVPPDNTRGQLELLAGSTGVNLEIPRGLAFDAQGNLYVSDSQHGGIRKISTSGAVRTFFVGDTLAGDTPVGLVVDGSGRLIVSDRQRHRILRIDANGVATVLAGSGQPGHSDGVGTSATFHNPEGLTMEADGDFIVADAGNNSIRRITATGVVTTVAGATEEGFVDGRSNAARFNYPQGVTITSSGDIVVTDTGNNRLRRIATDGTVTTLAGAGEQGHTDGSALKATFFLPSESVSDSAGNLYIADERNNLIRKLSNNGVVSTLAGAFERGRPLGIDLDGPTGVARIVSPFGIARGPDGDLYVSERSGAIRRIKPDGMVTTFASAGATGMIDGPPGVSRLHGPRGMVADNTGNIYLADSENRAIRRISAQGVVTTVAGSGDFGEEDGDARTSSFDQPSAVAVDSIGNLYVADGGLVRKISHNGDVSTLAGLKTSEQRKRNTANGPHPPPPFRWVDGIAVGPDGVVYAADSQADKIVKLSSDGTVTLVAGSQAATFVGNFSGYIDGPARVAEFHSPKSIAIGPDGAIYVADSGNHAIRKIKNGWVSTIAGGSRSPFGSHRGESMPMGGYADGPGAEAEFSYPVGVALDGRGNLIVVDRGNRAIRRIDANGFVTTLFGPERQFDTTLGPLPASVGVPEGVAVLPDGRLVISVLNGVLITKDVAFW